MWRFTWDDRKGFLESMQGRAETGKRLKPHRVPAQYKDCDRFDGWGSTPHSSLSWGSAQRMTSFIGSRPLEVHRFCSRYLVLFKLRSGNKGVNRWRLRLPMLCRLVPGTDCIRHGQSSATSPSCPIGELLKSRDVLPRS